MRHHHHGRREHGVRAVVPGAPPGQLTVNENATASETSVLAYGPEQLEQGGLADAASLSSRFPVIWLNVSGLGTHAVLEEIGRTFRIHPLVLEDVVNVGQRPKTETYDDELFLVLRMPRGAMPLHTEQVSFFLGKGHVLTFQEEMGDCFDPVRERIRAGRPRLRGGGPDYLLYALLDAVIDAYFPLIGAYADRIVELEAVLLDDDTADPAVGELFDLKRDLASIRRMVRPLREAVSELLRSESPLVTRDTELFLRDAYDHALQLMELAEMQHEQAAALIDIHRTNAQNRMNEVMKVLTIIATLFIPLSFVAGLYGMNFDPGASRWNMPELGWAYGYPALLTVMALIVIGMLFYFRRKGWLGGRRPPRREP
jgi:magnesium transporter